MTTQSIISPPLALQRQTLAAQIYASLEDSVLNGELPPGTRLLEDPLAERFGVSRAPVREALAALQRAGLAERAGPRERVVAVPDAAFIVQKYDLWWTIDVGRSYLSALEATAQDCAQLGEMVALMRAATVANDAGAYRKYCDAFHEKIRQNCKNPDLNQLGDGCDVHLRWFEMLYDLNPDISAATVHEHAEILSAYTAKHYARLADGIRVHILRQRDHILRLFTAAANGAALQPLRAPA